MRKTIAFLVAATLLGLLAWQIYLKVQQAREQEQAGAQRRGAPAVAVEIAAVRKTAVQEIGRFTGSLIPRSSFTIAPKVAGRLERLTVDTGDLVVNGQLLAELENDEYVQQLEQARAELAVVKAVVAETKSALELSAKELQRIETLREKKMASESELDETRARQIAADAKYRVALAEVSRREAALKAAEVRLSYTRIHVSWQDDAEHRVVGERFVDEGEMLRANDPIVSVLDNSVMTALVDVIERDYSKVHIGQSATIATDAQPDREFQGKVARIAPLLRETSRQAQIQIEILNTENLLKPGMFIRAQIEFARHEDVTVVPVDSIARRNGQQGVFLADTENLKVSFTPVVLGISDSGVVEVNEPVLSGYVVTLGQHLLEDGASINLPDIPDAGAGGSKQQQKKPTSGGGA